MSNQVNLCVRALRKDLPWGPFVELSINGRTLIPVEKLYGETRNVVLELLSQLEDAGAIRLHGLQRKTNGSTP